MKVFWQIKNLSTMRSLKRKEFKSYLPKTYGFKKSVTKTKKSSKKTKTSPTKKKY